MTADDDPVRLRVVVAAPADLVFSWLSEPELIGRWFGWEHDSLDDEIAMIFIDAASRSRSKLRFETNGGGLFLLEETAAGTVVELRRPADEGDEDWDAIDEGWTTFVQQLRLGVERHPDVERRVLELAGKHLAADAPRLWDALGLAQVAELEVGARYSAATPFGEELTGEVWFRTRHQLGVTVEGWGDGLLVAVQRPEDDERPYGAGQLVLTSYGLDPDAYGDWFGRWTRWATGALPG